MISETRDCPRCKKPTPQFPCGTAAVTRVLDLVPVVKAGPVVFEWRVSVCAGCWSFILTGMPVNLPQETVLKIAGVVNPEGR